MDELGLLLNYTIQDYSEEDNQLIIDLLKKSLEIIDKDINDNNGLAGYKLNERLLHLEKNRSKKFN